MNTTDLGTTLRDLVARSIAPSAAANDQGATFPAASMRALADAGYYGLNVPKELGGWGFGPREIATAVSVIAEGDASVAMIYLMHLMGTACIVHDRTRREQTLRDIAAGKHLTTLAFSEKGSRSHFWAPVSKAKKNGEKVGIFAQKSWVTSAGYADSYIVSTQSAGGASATESTLYLVSAGPGASVSSLFAGLGLRANASSPMMFELETSDAARLTEENAGFKCMLEVVLPLFNLGSACVALGLSRAATGSVVRHLKTATFEHLGQSLGEALPTLRARLAQMQIKTDALSALVDDSVKHLESPSELTMLRVLELKALGGETALEVTALAMRTCGGAAFSQHLDLERVFRDAQAGAVMAPTVDVVHEFIGKALLGIPLF